MARLRYSVNVRQTKPIDPKKPELGSTVVRQEFFKAGSDLPEWAQKLVGDHVYEDGEAPAPTTSTRTTKNDEEK